MIVGVWMLFIFLTLMNAMTAYVYRREIKLFFTEVYSKALKRSTPLQKEIEAEFKEIEQLEKQKADMDKLKELRARRERLFSEVTDYEVEREEEKVICHSCGSYMDYLGIDRSRREVYECKDCILTLKAPL